jgi:hypothetical protein
MKRTVVPVGFLFFSTHLPSLRRLATPGAGLRATGTEQE